MSQVEDFIEAQLEAIDEQITKINESKIMRAAEGLIEQRGKLQAARRALLGAGNKVTGEGGTRVTQGEVVAFMEGKPPMSAVDIANAMGHGEAVIRGHLNRGKDERFEKVGNDWQLRDPEQDEDDEE